MISGILGIVLTSHPSSGFQINLVHNDDDQQSGILAQSNKFNVKGSTSSSSTATATGKSTTTRTNSCTSSSSSSTTRKHHKHHHHHSTRTSARPTTTSCTTRGESIESSRGSAMFEYQLTILVFHNGRNDNHCTNDHWGFGNHCAADAFDWRCWVVDGAGTGGGRWVASYGSVLVWFVDYELGRRMGRGGGLSVVLLGHIYSYMYLYCINGCIPVVDVFC